MTGALPSFKSSRPCASTVIIVFLDGGVFLNLVTPFGRFDSGWPSGSANHAAEVAAAEGRILICEHVGLNVAKCGLWLVLYPVVESLDDVFLEMIGARVCMHDSLAFNVAILSVSETEHVHFDASSY